MIHWIARLGNAGKADYFSNCLDGCIDGWEVEYLSQKMVGFLHKKELPPTHKEHVTSYIRENKESLKNDFRIGSYKQKLPYDAIPKLSVDTVKDIIYLRKMEVK